MNSLLKLENINKSFNKKILYDFNYDFNATGLYSIYGISGSGKSTLLNIIAGFDTPDTGKVHRGFSKLEYVMQEHMLFNNISVRDNLYIKLNLTNYKKDEYDTVIINICEKLTIKHLIDEKVSFLSGGEKQRVSLARALLNVPEILLLDEPTASIDQEVKEDLLNLLLNLSKEKLIIVTTHDPFVKKYADAILLLESGKLQ